MRLIGLEISRANTLGYLTEGKKQTKEQY